MSSLISECPPRAIDVNLLKVELPPLRRCARCKSIKVAKSINFYTCNNRLSPWCRECHKEVSRQYKINHREEALEYMEKWHRDNKDREREYGIKNRDRFNSLAKNRYWKYPEKNRSRARDWRKKQPQYSKNKDMDTRIKRTFGISLDQYNYMLSKQDNKCAICFGKNHNNKKLAIDHDHITGKVRGLLCSRCNTVIGLAKDSGDLLRKIINYIETIKDSNIKYTRWTSYKYFNDLLKTLGDSCKICGDDGSSSKISDKKHGRKRIGLDIDHNHKTGMMRSVLCHSCNSILGQFEENIKFIFNAINYIGKYNGNT